MAHGADYFLRFPHAIAARWDGHAAAPPDDDIDSPGAHACLAISLLSRMNIIASLLD